MNVIMKTLYSDLESLCIIWLKLGLSVILKLYLLYSYLPNFLLRINDFSDITESRIKWYYQEKEKDKAWLFRLKCCEKTKNSMA